MRHSFASGKVVYALLLASVLAGITAEARADVLDARTLSMGGAQATNAQGTAFAPMHNPASVGGNWNMILPGVSLGYGSNLFGMSDLIKLGQSATGSGGTQAISDLLGRLGSQPTSRVELNVGVPLVGFTGHPFPLTAAGGAPVDFGFNVYANGGALVSMTGSAGILGIFSNSSTVIGQVQSLQTAIQTAPAQLQSAVTQASGAVTGLTNLSSGNISDFNTAVTALNGAVSALTTIQTTINNTLPPVQSAATAVSSALAPLGTSDQSLSGQIAADGHLTLALTGKVPVVKSTIGSMPFELAVGGNLKGFIMPGVAKIPSLIGSLTGAGGQDSVPPVGLTLSMATKPLQSAKTLTDTVNSANTVISSAQKTYGDILKNTQALIPIAQQGAQAQAAGNQQGMATAASSLASGVGNLINTAKGQTDTVNQLNTSFGNLAGLQTQLQTDLNSLQLQAKSFTNVSPVGAGVDLGVMAKFGDEISAGASLDNALVVWPAQQKTTTLAINTAGGSPFKVVNETAATSANYNATEPTAFRLGGAYQPKVVEGLTVAADLEQVFNGRPFAAHAGVEKRFFNVLGVRVGGQLGGIGSMVTGGVGVKAGGFNLDLGGGTDFNRNTQAAANLSLAF